MRIIGSRRFASLDNNLKNFSLRLQDFSIFGAGLTRPECVRADREGRVGIG